MRTAATVAVSLCVILETTTGALPRPKAHTLTETTTGALPRPKAHTLTATSDEYPLGFVHIPKTGGSTIEKSAITCDASHMYWGAANPTLLLATQSWLMEDAPLSGATDFCVSSPFDIGTWDISSAGVIYAEHVPPIFWVNQYKSDLYSEYSAGVFASVRNPITRAVSSWKHFSGVMFNATQQDAIQLFGKTSPLAAVMSWPESEACDPRHLNDWLARYLTDAKPRIARIEAVQELPAGKPCSDEYEDLHASGARSTTLDSGFQNTIPQWLYVQPLASTNAPQGYKVPAERIIAQEDLAAGFTTLMNRTAELYDGGRDSPVWQCLAALDLDDPDVAVSNMEPFGEVDCSTGDLTAALNETVLAMIRTIYARDFELLGYPTELSRVYELPQIMNLSSSLRETY
tara:strand:+ start:140 stop:1345 length:1206 start_codon:yes stop_codon:yes gene_type:complete